MDGARGGAAVCLVGAGFLAAGGAPVVLPDGFLAGRLTIPGAFRWNLLLFARIAALEELVWRGWLLDELRGRVGLPLAVALTSAGYAAPHLGVAFLPPGEPWWGVWVTTWVAGCVFAAGRLRYGLAAAWAAHWSADLVLSTLPDLLAEGSLAAWVTTAGALVLPLGVGAAAGRWRRP